MKRITSKLTQFLGLDSPIRPVNCPQCSSRDVVPIVYGLPSDETAGAALAGAIVLGGCGVSSDNPLYHCHECELEFLPPEITRARRKRDERFAEYYRLRAANPAETPASTPSVPCPHCGEALRTPLAMQCRFCLRDWHDPSTPRRLPP